MPSSPLIIKHHIPGVAIATVWAWVPASTFRSISIPAMDTLLSACNWVDKGGTDTFDSYKFKGFDAMEEKTDMMRAIFVPDLSLTYDTPVRTFNSTEESFYWPAVLTSITFNHVEEWNGTFSLSSYPTNLSYWSVVPKLINSYHGLTKIQINDYISDVASWTVTTESLHPTKVHWSLPGHNGTGSVPECLTDTVNVPAVYMANAGFGGGTTIAAARTIAATPHTTWPATHVYSDVVTFADGLYFRRTKTAYKPPNTPGES